MTVQRLFSVAIAAAMFTTFARPAGAQDRTATQAIGIIDFGCQVTWLVATDTHAACRLAEIDYEDPQLQGKKGEWLTSSVVMTFHGLGIEGVGDGFNHAGEAVPSGCSARGAAPPLPPAYCRDALAEVVSTLTAGGTECSLVGKVNELDAGSGSPHLPIESGPGSFYTFRGARFYCAGAKDQIITAYGRALKTTINLAPLAKPRPQNQAK